jgi:L-asparaginase
MSPDMVTSAVDHGAKGLVIAGVGDGNMTAPTVDALKQVIAKGVVVVRSSRTNGGIIRRNIELNDDQIGTVASMELNPAKARVLLQLALMKSKDAKTIQGYFDRY